MTDNVVYGVDFHAGLNAYRINRMQKHLEQTAMELAAYGLGFCASIGLGEDNSPCERNPDDCA